MQATARIAMTVGVVQMDLGLGVSTCPAPTPPVICAWTLILYPVRNLSPSQLHRVLLEVSDQLAHSSQVAAARSRSIVVVAVCAQIQPRAPPVFSDELE